MPFLSPLARRAFTLIELLIVVAIIAILAAIAVPNFLEAQVRSKVSRTKSDMRTVATALESYRVDNNKYPPAHCTTAGPNYTCDGTYRTRNPRVVRQVPLTTPVSYMTSVPQDIFSQVRSSVTDDNNVRAFVYSDRASYEQAFGPQALNGGGGAIYAILWRFEYPSGSWLLRSWGPIGGVGDGASIGNQLRANDAYDPTNGTVSSGNIIMLGSGIGFLGS